MGTRDSLALVVPVPYIYAPISGPGGLGPEGTGANFYLYGNNSYAGGTAFGYSGAPLTYFNSSSSFGSEPIRLVSGVASGTFFGVLGTGGSTINLPNAFQILSSGAGFNFAANPSIRDQQRRLVFGNQ